MNLIVNTLLLFGFELAEAQKWSHIPEKLVENAERIKNDKVVRINLNEDHREHSDLLFKLNNDDAEDLRFETFTELRDNDNENGKIVDAQVDEAVYNLLLNENFDLQVLDDHLGLTILNSYPKNLRADSFNVSTYNTYEDTTAWMNNLAQQNPELLSIESAGSTFEKRNIPAIKISTGKKDKAIFFNTGIHAREWIGPAHLIYILDMMLKELKNDPENSEMARFLKSMDFYMIFNSNPDGYVHTWTTDRMWRKTRTDHGYTGCFREDHNYGADPNRNFPIHWDDPDGASTNPCNDAYKGPYEGSETTVQSQMAFVQKVSHQYSDFAYMDIHSYSQLFMYNYAYTYDLPSNSAILDQIVRNTVNAIQDTFGTKFDYGPIAQTIYTATGSTVDYMMDYLGISCNFAPELRDKGRYGFNLPDWMIPDVALEMYNGYKVIMAYVEAGACPMNI